VGKARDEAGNIWETDAQGNPVRLIQSAQKMNPAFANPMLPGQIQGQGLNNQGQQLQNVRTQQQIATQPLQNENTAVNIQQGRAGIQNQRFNQVQGLRQEFNNLPEVKNYSIALQSLGTALKAPNTPQGDLAIIYAYAKAADPGSVVREGEMDMANATASLPEQYRAAAQRLTQGKRLPPEVRMGLIETMRQSVGGMRLVYDQQRARYADAAKQNNIPAEQIVGKPLYDAYRPIEEQYIRSHGGTPRDPFATADYSDMVGGPGANVAQMDPNSKLGAFKQTYRNEYDPASAAKLSDLIRAGRPYEEAAAFAQNNGFLPPNPQDYAKAVAFAQRHQGATNVEATKAVPTTLGERLASSPAGAFGVGAGKAMTLGFGDEMLAALSPGDYATNRDDFAVRGQDLAAAHPYADLAGQAAGGAVTGLGINSLASRVPGAAGALFGARTPLPSLLNRGAVIGDTAYGAGYGAGSDNQDRLGGALTGAALAAGGGIAARGTVNGLASAISPTGGALRPLYDMGVRPSIGQRMGGIVNNLEEKVQSLPVIGDAIKGTRDRARDQFQIGLFNDSLGDIGQTLPAGMKVGHEPHAFAQNAFNQAYDAAKSGMTAVADGGWTQDIGNLQQTVGALRPESQQQFAKLWTGSVARRMQDGVLSGSAFKDATSELEKKVAAIRSNKNGDGELADALQQASDALKSSALRNSPPEAVAAMNAADKGYAKLVRIETASRSAAGEPAEFSPSQYNSAVRTASGGVRNREYLRGDALNTDIAALGTRLGDKVSNSGTVDRYAPLAIASGMGYVEPMSAAALGGYGLLNAPGIRGITTGLMAPRTNPFLKAAGDELRQRARLAGMFGAPIALDYYGAQ
jgi:hypothetical protein